MLPSVIYSWYLCCGAIEFMSTVVGGIGGWRRLFPDWGAGRTDWNVNNQQRMTRSKVCMFHSCVLVHLLVILILLLLFLVL